ncbi:MAG: helix-turn-helix domain-containing protein, partial [Nonomuraea sp.]|nr:helix-turn-helix domain-containing protein [Nonomuraea sp.]
GILTDGREQDADGRDQQGREKDGSGSEQHPAVTRLCVAMDDAPERDWTLPELGRAVSLDPDHVGRLFRTNLGLSPLAYLARVRAERAAALLANTDLPVSRVGAAVGWGDPTYFARRFRSLVGLTPTAYRRVAASSSSAR